MGLIMYGKDSKIKPGDSIMNKTKSIIIAVDIVLAMSLTFSCSSNDDGDSTTTSRI